MREQLVETPTVVRLKAARAERRQEAFYGRISRSQALAVNRLYPHALAIWLELRRREAMRWPRPFVLGDDDLRDIQILPQTRDRALNALEQAGLIRVERQRGRLPRIWLVEGPQRDRRGCGDAKLQA
jgi:hypothetical protein